MGKTVTVGFKECTEYRYNELLEVLPPLGWVKKGFLVSEPWSHRVCRVAGNYRATYQAVVHHCSGKFYESTEGVTLPEWRALDPVTLTFVTEEK